MDVTLKDIVATSISVASLALSAYALWLVQFSHGRLKMTQRLSVSSVNSRACGRRFFSGPCSIRRARRGRVIENMYLNVRQDYGTHPFDFWGHAESSNLTLGSALFPHSARRIEGHGWRAGPAAAQRHGSGLAEFSKPTGRPARLAMSTTPTTFQPAGPTAPP